MHDDGVLGGWHSFPIGAFTKQGVTIDGLVGFAVDGPDASFDVWNHTWAQNDTFAVSDAVVDALHVAGATELRAGHLR